jgi:hypothetical protein
MVFAGGCLDDTVAYQPEPSPGGINNTEAGMRKAGVNAYHPSVLLHGTLQKNTPAGHQ